MSSRLAVTAVVAATLCAAALPALAQGSGADPDRVNRDVPLQQPARPNAAPAAAPGPAPAPAPAQPRGADRRDQGQRDANRQQHQGQGQQDHRQADRRNWDHRAPERRNFGYVVPVAPRPYYYSAPYYAPPAVYYGGVAQAYYPSQYDATPLMFRPGDYLPPEYRAQQFVVEDWQWRGLPAPPLGYHWLFVGPDNFALVADATGQILSVTGSR